MSEAAKQYVTMETCDTRHGGSKARFIGLLSLLGVLVAVSVWLLGQSWAATTAANAAAANYEHVRESLTEIRTDVREIRATQIESMRNGKGKSE